MNQSELIQIIKERSSSSKRFLTIAIDGPSGSGKSSLAKYISSEISGTSIVHMDDLYRGWLLTIGPNLTRELLSIVEQLRATGSAFYSKYDWHENLVLPPSELKVENLLILEGVGSAQAALEDRIDLRIWLEVPVEIGLQRAIARDGQQIAPFMESFLEEQDAYFTTEQTKERSDFHLMGN